MSATIDELLRDARRRLAAAPFSPSPREAALLLAYSLGLDEAQVLARGDRTPTAEAGERFQALLERRLAGEPVAYLKGEKEFYGRPFRVDSRVLVPRPETEHLVAEALGLALPAAPAILDLGTGSGCLAVTLALEIPGSTVVAVDRSLAALAVAAANARDHGVTERLRLASCDLASGLALDGFDLVVSNPPYLDPVEADELSPEITRFEPAAALFAGKGGLEMIARMVEGLGSLRPGSELLIEIGMGQEPSLRERVSISRFSLLGIAPDYAGIPRVAHLRRD